MTIYRRADPIPFDPPALRVTEKPDPAPTLKRDDLHRAAARIIFEAIAGDDYPEGSVIPNEATLGLQLGISRTALREAIKGLVSKGLLQTRRRVGTTVRSRNEWNLLDSDILDWTRRRLRPDAIAEELAAVLAVIEPSAAEAAAGAMARQSVTGSLASLRAVWNSSDQAAGVAAFHRTVATAGGNRFVTSIVNSIYGDFVRNDPAYLVRRSKAAGVGSYQALAEAIADADRAHAAALMGRLLTHDPVRA